MADTPLPTDAFSRELRAMQDNPGAVCSESTIRTSDFYGNTETWVVTTYRVNDGREQVFLQRNGADGGTRFVLPLEVTAAMVRHRDHLSARMRRRGARQAVATKRLRGIAVGNPDALRRARNKRRKG